MGKRILVIDDEEGVRDAFKLSLSDSGHVLETAASGDEGIAKAEQARPDLIFLDLRMPGIDGIATLKHLQEHCAGIPIYIVTAFHKDYLQQLEELAKEGISFEVAQKPLSSGNIQLIVEAVLTRAKT